MTRRRLLLIGERAIPINMAARRRHQAASQQPLDLVFQPDLVVGNRPGLQHPLRQAQRTLGQQPQIRSYAAGAIGKISAEQFVGAFAAERDFGRVRLSLARNHSGSAPASALGSSE